MRPDFEEEISVIPGLNLRGKIRMCSNAIGIGCKSVKPSDKLNLSEEFINMVVCCEYEKPEQVKHSTNLLPGIKIPRRSVTMRDIQQTEKKYAGENTMMRYLIVQRE
jgi:hypothetical protein